MLNAVQLLWMRLQLAMDILTTMDTSLDPCQDFYQFACGNYNRRVNLPDDKPQVNPIVIAHQQILDELRDLLETGQHSNDSHTTNPPSRSESLVRRFYGSCTNVSAMESQGLDPVRAILRKYGDWPVILGDRWTNTTTDWILLNAQLSRHAELSPIIRFDLSPDYKNSLRRILHIDQPVLGLGKRDYYLSENYSTILDAYLRYMIQSAVQLGAQESSATREMELVLQFEKDLAQASQREEERRDVNVLYRPDSVGNLKTRHHKVGFSYWFDYMAKAGGKFTDDDTVNVDGEEYLKRLPDVLSNYSARTLANYQLWQLVNKLSPYLPPSKREPYRAFTQAITGTLKFKARWEECVEEVLKLLEMPIGALYVKRYFSEDSKKEIDAITDTIRRALARGINGSVWMDRSTKDYAESKLSSMVRNMAYPADKIDNETWLMLSHKNSNLSNDRYVKNVVSLWQSSVDREWSEFREPIDRTEWREGFAVVNAWYSNNDNIMTFPAGILRYPFFAPYSPHYVNYGRIGAVIGHESTHGFDDQGRQFDADGNFRFWWTNDTVAEFKRRARCFIDQYSSVKDPTTGQHLNGENTQGENIADNGGVKLAYEAYQIRTTSTENGSECAPNGYFGNYTADQLFFISYAQVWCSLVRPEQLKRQIILDSHSPAKYRVNVVLQNNRNFSHAFRCPIGSAMNPKRKCQIW